MKKYLLLSIFGLLISISAYSQETDEKVFPESDAIWSINYYIYGSPHYIYGLSGDTIVNEKRYSKLYLLNDSTLNIDENDIYVGGIRQKNKIVYLQPAQNISGKELAEFILYDFSKGEGEEVTFQRHYDAPGQCYPTFEYTSNYTSYTRLIKEEKDTKYGRMLVFDEYSMNSWVEGIGSLNGLFFPRIDEALSGYRVGGELICMKEKGEIKYKNKQFSTCFPLKVSITEDQIVKIQPKYDPLNKTIELSDIESLYLPYTFSVISLEGKTLINYTIAESNTNINASHLHSGVYIYSVAADKIKHTGKIIIQ